MCATTTPTVREEINSIHPANVQYWKQGEEPDREARAEHHRGVQLTRCNRLRSAETCQRSRRPERTDKPSREYRSFVFQMSSSSDSRLALCRVGKGKCGDADGVQDSLSWGNARTSHPTCEHRLPDVLA
jgi:hypothetical protein